MSHAIKLAHQTVNASTETETFTATPDPPRRLPLPAYPPV
jgi:hypothetical protein